MKQDQILPFCRVTALPCLPCHSVAVFAVSQRCRVCRVTALPCHAHTPVGRIRSIVYIG